MKPSPINALKVKSYNTKHTNNTQIHVHNIQKHVTKSNIFQNIKFILLYIKFPYFILYFWYI